MKIKRKRVLKALRALDTYVQLKQLEAENSSWLPVIVITTIMLGIGILIGVGLAA